MKRASKNSSTRASSEKKTRTGLSVTSTMRVYQYIVRFKRALALSILIFGLSLLVLPEIVRYLTKNHSIQEASITAETTQESTSSSTLTQTPFAIDYDHFKSITHERFPTRIIIPSLLIDLPITVAKVKNGAWEISETTASYGQGSAVPGENSNSIIFAHARPNLFGPLRNSTFGTSIYILMTDSWKRYQVKEIRFVSPSALEEIKPTNYEVLTLFTCSGFFDEKRMIIKAYPN